MALHQHSCWRSVKPPCQRGTHTNLPKSLMEPVKTTGPYTGSIIDFILALLLRTHHAMHTNGGPFRGPADRRVKLATVSVVGMKVGKAKPWRLFLAQVHVNTHNRMSTPSHTCTLPDLPPKFGVQPGSSSVKIAGLTNWGFFCVTKWMRWKSSELPCYTVSGAGLSKGTSIGSMHGLYVSCVYEHAFTVCWCMLATCKLV